MPDSASEQAKPTVTSVLFHPATFAAGLRLGLIDGAVLSSLTVTEPVPTLPSLSEAVAVLTTAAASVVTVSVAGVGPESTPEPASVADHVRPTLALFQPAAFGAGVSAAVTTGPVLSRVYDPVFVRVVPVQSPWPLKLGDAAAVTDCTPSPEPAVVVNVQVDLAVADCWWPVKAPATSTHSVSLLALTVRVSAPPDLAYSVPPSRGACGRGDRDAGRTSQHKSQSSHNTHQNHEPTTAHNSPYGVKSLERRFRLCSPPGRLGDHSPGGSLLARGPLRTVESTLPVSQRADIRLIARSLPAVRPSPSAERPT